MRTPRQLEPLVDEGLIDEVIRPLMAGKEAEVYLVVSEGEICCAKVYKDSDLRSFRQRSTYQEGRKVRSSRKGRAMGRGSKFGRDAAEADWQHAEVDALRRLSAAGVRVPEPLHFSHGVLLMELITDKNGDTAPRLNDTALTPELARKYHSSLMRDVVKMLSAGLIHGDLSEYNILLEPDGPVIIDLPQAVDAAANNSASELLRRDVDNLRAYFGQFAPELLKTNYGREIWQLYKSGDFHPDMELTGIFHRPEGDADVDGVMRDIDDARKEMLARQRTRPEEKPDETWRGIVPDAEDLPATNTHTSPSGRRRVTDMTPPKPAPAPEKTEKKRRRRRRRGPKPTSPTAANRPQAPNPSPAKSPGPPTRGAVPPPKSAAPPTDGGPPGQGDPPRRRRRRRR